MEQDESREELQTKIDGLVHELESVRKSERHYRDLFNEAPECMFVVDLRGNVLGANKSALRETGYTEEEAKLLTIFRFLSPESFDRLAGEFKHVLGGEQTAPAECKLLRKDGGCSWIDLELRAVKEGPKPVAVQIIARDASPRKDAEEAMKCSRENLERVLNGLPEAALVESADHIVEFANNAARALFGDVKGKKCYEALKGLRESCVSRDCPVEEVITNRRNACRTTHHEGKVWEITAIPLLNADGSTSVLEIVRDVTIARQTDEKLKASERLAILGRVAVEMAHEIKNPLSAVATFAQLLPERYDDEEFRQVFTRTALQAVTRINYLMEQLVSFARPLKPVLEETDLREVIEEALMEVHQHLSDKAIHLSTDFAPEPLLAPMDPQQVKRAVLEFLTNSIDAVKEGGNIALSARLVSDADEHAPGMLEVAVSDDGHGIPPKDLNRVFEPFFTTSSEKLGLGLAIAQRIIEEHGGSIELKSQPGHGATFSMKLRTH